MAYATVKLREVAGSLVITIPKTVLQNTEFAEGDRVTIDIVSEHRLRVERVIRAKQKSKGRIK